MSRLTKYITLLCLLIISNILSAQSDYCYELGTAVNLSTLDFSDCSGPLTYSINGGGLNCTDCENNQTFTATGNFVIIAYSEGNPCDQVSVSVYEEPVMILNSVGSPNCNEYSYDANYSGQVSEWEWDFNNNNQSDASTQSGSYTFLSNGSQTVNLTIITNQGCEITTSVTEPVGGPLASLSTFGIIDGNSTALVETAFNDLQCVIPYCVEDPEDDYTVDISNVDLGNSSGTNVSYELTLNGNIIYGSSPTPPSGFDLNLETQGGTLGYNQLIYTIVDDNGCEYAKEYQVYWEEDSFPTANLDNVTPDEVAEGTSQYCIGDPLEFEISASSLSGVSYIFAIGCGALDFNSLDPI